MRLRGWRSLRVPSFFFFFFLFPFFVRGETDSSASPSVLFLPPFISLSLFLSLSPATIIRFHRFCISSVSLIILFRFDFFITEITCEGHGTCCRSFLNRWVSAPNPLFCILENRWCVKLDVQSLSLSFSF